MTAFAISSVVAHWNDLAADHHHQYGKGDAAAWSALLPCRRGRGAHGSDPGDHTLPLVVAFLAAQRRFIEGITLIGLKGRTTSLISIQERIMNFFKQTIAAAAIATGLCVPAFADTTLADKVGISLLRDDC